MGQHPSRATGTGDANANANANGLDLPETQRLLPPDEAHVDADCPTDPHADLPVYTTIHRIRRDILAVIDDPYSLDQLRDPRMNITVVRPLVDKFYALDDVSIIYCLLVNKVQFQKEQLTKPHQQSVCTTRALLCEVLAIRILRRYNEDNLGAQGLLLLSRILVGGFDPFQSAPQEVVRERSSLSWVVQTRTGHQRRLPALEIAIISGSKTFLSSSACQRVVNAIYEGRVVYTPSSWLDILPDHYKQRPISLYNPRRAPLFNQYRLSVPRTRNILEVCEFVLLLVVFLVVMADRDPSTTTWKELIFIIFTLGWTLDQFASILEHGWSVYTQNLWSFLDVTFSTIFAVYLIIRIHGWRSGNLEVGQQAMDVLAMGAPVLIPRLAFNLMSENMLFVSLRAMMRDFAVLTVLAVWCFAGFLLAMVWLSDGEHKPITISKWMLWVWFGLDATGIQKSVEFHWCLGPILMVAFAFLGNTLFLTILVSMLSTTFSTIVSNATAEIQFRRAVLTLEGVKSDAIFAYRPPFNILALAILLPLKTIVSPRWFHKINVASVRALNAPLLLIIGLVERRILWAGARRQKEAEQLPRTRSRAGFWNFPRGFSAYSDISAVFDAEPPESVENEISNDDTHRHLLEDEVSNEFPRASSVKPQNGPLKNRRDSSNPFAGLSSRIKSLLTEAGDEDDSTDIKGRLEALEGSTRRIEKILGRLCDNLDNSAEQSSSIKVDRESPSLNKSGFTDIGY